MDTPGYDPPCTTGLVAGGANVLVFTTGRGSVLGLQPTPCIKLATNTPMFERMIDDMDIDAGRSSDGERVEEVGREDIFEPHRGGEREPSQARPKGNLPWSLADVVSARRPRPRTAQELAHRAGVRFI